MKTFKSVGVMKKFIKEFKPDIVVGTGGYICVPVGFAAKKAKVPMVLHESNAFPGVAVKVLSKKADEIFVGFEDAKARIPKAKKVMVSGTPTKIKKIDYTKADIEKQKRDLGFKSNFDMPLVLVFGGSQGAKSINNALINIIKQDLNKNYQIVWAVGKANYDGVVEELKKSDIDVDNIENTKVLSYIYNMEEVMNTSDLVLSRSGAMTITEIAKLQKASIFIPFPFATENHQEFNARAMEKIGAAKVILDKDLDDKVLNDMIEELIKDKDKLKEMGKMAATVSKDDVEGIIYREIVEIIKNRKEK
jgi:UDP-N-acetylglucosamine--N-acetylmuramyl-(pentapeptide) pyrophosphoryl-undecaprenol N-acetylglucosamine transferase